MWRRISKCKKVREGEVCTKKVKRYSVVASSLFKGKQNIPWNDVEEYLKQYIGQSYVVDEYQDLIAISGEFPDEYTESRYTKSLRGAVAKVKANVTQVLEKLIVNATNKRWLENKNEKHSKNAAEGWYRYDTYFCMQVQGCGEEKFRWNYYVATLVVRKTQRGMFLYDIINIKKEASTPLKSK